MHSRRLRSPDARLILTSVALAAGLLAPVCVSAATYLGSFKGHDYYATSANLTFDQAHAEATALGAALGRRAYMAAITTIEERDFLYCLGLPSSWIGVHRIAGPPLDVYRWAWDSGEPYIYDTDLWCSGEPNDYFGLGENAGLFPWGTMPCINDIQDTLAQAPGGIIEVEPNE